MRKIIAIVHISLDGYAAGLKGELTGFEPGEDNLQFVCKISQSADTALFGRTSYELLEAHWPDAGKKNNATPGEIAYSDWYNHAEKIVISKTLTPKTGRIIIRDNICETIQDIKNGQGKDILIFGSPSICQLLFQYYLIDYCWIFINPAVFGKGIPLFAYSDKPIHLHLQSTHVFTNGEMAVLYEVKNNYHQPSTK